MEDISAENTRMNWSISENLIAKAVNTGRAVVARGKTPEDIDVLVVVVTGPNIEKLKLAAAHMIPALNKL